MVPSTRREFVGTAAAFAAATVARPGLCLASERHMTIDFAWWALGIEADQSRAVELAVSHGFESVGARGEELARMTDAELDALLEQMREGGLRWGAANLPVDFRFDEERYRGSLAGLADFARGLTRAGVSRVGTWLMPGSETLTYRKYFDVVASRLREVATLLDGEGLRLGLEYVGPKTSWTRLRYPFVHTLAETLELAEEIGVANVGLVLDSWHWFLAGDTVDQLRELRNEQVVAVDLNDAPAGIPADEQRDGSRELPAATGVIPIGDFLGALVAMGYDGPVRAEPFNQRLNALPDEEATAATVAAMRKAFALLG
jgi:sugar phosphate isomerase/epimerase